MLSFYRDIAKSALWPSSASDPVSSIIASCEHGDIPEAIAYSMFPIPNIPSAKWSWLNRTLMFLIGTQDARGFRQLRKAGRYVKKGSKAFYILVPFLVKTENQKTGETEDFLKGFLCKPVFRAEDTTGEPLDHEQIDLPDLLLNRKAEEWGVSVKAIPGN